MKVLKQFNGNGKYKANVIGSKMDKNNVEGSCNTCAFFSSMACLYCDNNSEYEPNASKLCPCCDGTGKCEGEHYDDIKSCLTCGGSGRVC